LLILYNFRIIFETIEGCTSNTPNSIQGYDEYVIVRFFKKTENGTLALVDCIYLYKHIIENNQMKYTFFESINKNIADNIQI
jgi:hypothetical protein